MFINIADVSELPTLPIDAYNVIIILHTWEYGKPPKVVSEFIEAHTSEKDNMIVMATSGAGTNKINGVDLLAGESILENASDSEDEIIERIEAQIK